MIRIRRLFNVLIGWRWRPRTIRRDPRQFPPYLARWYLTKIPTMPDGSFPFDTLGEPRAGIQNDDSSYSL